MDAGGKQVLELYGDVHRKLHRPGIVEAGCWILASANFAGLLVVALPLYRGFLPLFPGAWTLMRAAMLASAVLNLAIAAGIVLIVVGNLADRALNPWPRRLWLAAEIVGAGLAFMANESLVRVMTASVRTTSNADFYFHVLLPLEIGSLLFLLFGEMCLLIYALQMAAWLRSRALARASIVVVSLAMIVSAAHLALIANDMELIANDRELLGLSESVVRNLHMAENLGRLIVTTLLAIYTFVIALRLNRYRRRRFG